MKLPALITTDLHFTANPRDEYRWGIWSWLRKTCAKESVKTLLILGDLTDAKDYHPAELVNRIVKEVALTRQAGIEILILQGNHDYLRAGHAYFAFLSTLPGVTFITKPLDTGAYGEAALFLPHTKNPAKDWADMRFDDCAYVFMHQTVSGAVASNGQKMEGDAFPDLSGAGKVYSGDIHVPQKIGCVEYVGSPYHVHFGDRFKPRCVLIDSFRKAHDLRFRTISRITLDCLPGEFLVPGSPTLELREGDQVKLRIHLTAAEMHEWAAIKRNAAAALAALKAETCGIELIPPKVRKRFGGQAAARVLTTSTPEEALLRFVELEGLSGPALDLGLELLE